MVVFSGADIALVLRAIKEAAPWLPRLQLLVVDKGSGKEVSPSCRAARRLVSSLGLELRVHFRRLDGETALSQALGAADLLALPEQNPSDLSLGLIRRAVAAGCRFWQRRGKVLAVWFACWRAVTAWLVGEDLIGRGPFIKGWRTRTFEANSWRFFPRPARRGRRVTYLSVLPWLFPLCPRSCPHLQT